MVESTGPFSLARGKEEEKRSVGPRSREDPFTPSGSALSMMVSVIITKIITATAMIMRAVNCY